MLGPRRGRTAAPVRPTPRFPLGDWISDHADCRYDLATSGMRGSIPGPRWPRRRAAEAALGALQQELARHLRVARERVMLAHGASEANAWVVGYLAGRLRRPGRAPRVRVEYPEYPPLVDVARTMGFRVRGDRRPADLAILSRPRNPEGDLWPKTRVREFAQDTRHLLVDETFLEFAPAPSLSSDGTPGLWTTGSFTKFFGADEARVGFVVTPPEEVDRFGRYVGVVSDEVAPASAAVALDLLRRLPEVRSAVRGVVESNARALEAAYPHLPVPVAPLFLDRLGSARGRPLAERCARSGVLVCPGEFFGAPHAVRLTLTRRNFPRALAAYRRLRGSGD